MFDTFSIFWCTASSSFCWVAWSLNSSFFLSLDSWDIPPSEKFWLIFKKLGILFEGSNFLEILKVLEDKIGNFSYSAVLEVGVDGRRSSQLWAFVLAAGVQNGRAFVLFKAMTKYGKPSAKEHQIWWSVKKRQKMKTVCLLWSNKIKIRERGGVANRKASFYQFEAWQWNFEASKCANSTLLPLSINYPFKQ